MAVAEEAANMSPSILVDGIPMRLRLLEILFGRKARFFKNSGTPKLCDLRPTGNPDSLILRG